jgi:hypothetical protein
MWLKWYFHYFEESPLIVFNELFVHILELCVFTHKVEILLIWISFILLKESFYI